MYPIRRAVTAMAALALGMCAYASGQVLNQAPADAVGVLEVKSLSQASDKVAKFAKSLGIDQLDPRFADPLAALMDEMDVKKGVNKDGDMAFAFFLPPEKGEGAPVAEPKLVVLIPTSDYEAFLTNFQDVKDAGGGLSTVVVPKNHETLFVQKRGGYAAAAMDKELLAKPVGMKIEGAAAKEVQEKDAVVYLDMKAMRPHIEKALKEGRKQFEQGAKEGGPIKIEVTAKKMLEQYFKFAEEFVRDSHSLAISLNLSDFGISSSTIADFEPESDWGKVVGAVHNTTEPLLTGLPKATYFAVGGMQATPEVMTKLVDQFIVPILGAGGAKNEQMETAIKAMRQAMTAAKLMSMGYVANNGAPGDGLLSAVTVTHGDAKTILDAQKAMLPVAANMFGGADAKMKVDVKPGEPKTVDGVDLQSYTMKFQVDPNEPQAAQAQQVISLMYGRNGMVVQYGAVNPNTIVQMLGGNEQLLSDLIASAKNNTDTLDENHQIEKVTKMLPKERSAEFFIELDNVATSVVKVAKQFGFPVQFKLPPNLPPIGVSAGAEGTTVRVDTVIPNQLVQSMTAAVMQAIMQAQGGPGGGI